jgi:pyridoxal/pyridoxine/pyridoxamine kinase
MSYDLNYVKYLSGMITESQLRGDEPVNEIFGYPRTGGPGDLLTAKQITDFLRDMADEALGHPDEGGPGHPDSQAADSLKQDVERVCADIEEVMQRAKDMKIPLPKKTPTLDSSRRSGGGHRLGRARQYSGISPNAFR